MIGELIDRLIDNNINIELVEQDKLKIHADISKIPADLLSEIKLKKEDLVKYLADRQSSDRFERIAAVPVQQNYVLSSTQRRLWILGQFEESNVAYNRPQAFIFDRGLNIDALKHAFDALIARHESLRTVFRETAEGEVRQIILAPADAGFSVIHLDLRNEDNKEEKAQAFVQEDFVRPFNLGTGPLLRASLYQVEDNKWIFCYVMHHIISDGWSMGVLINELMLIYNTHSNGQSNPLQPLRIHYKDYAAWQQEQLSGPALEAHKAYWLKHFEGELPVLSLPSEKQRPAVKTYNGESIIRQISKEALDGISTICMQEGSTLFMGMLAAVNALFYRYTSQEDIIIGTPVAGREHIDLEDQIGFYANTLALRTQFSASDTYRQLLDNVRRVTLGAYEHQVYPFDQLVDELNMQRDRSRNPLFDVQVIVENAGTPGAGAKAQPGKMAISSYDQAENGASVFDMVLNFIATENGLQVNIVYNTDVYERPTVEILVNHLEQLMRSISANPDSSISHLDYMSAQERNRILVDLNSKPLPASEARTILDLFAKQVNKNAGVTAVVFGDRQLTYRELDEQSNRLAHYLENNYSIQPDQPVGVLLDRSEKLVISFLAILKAGGVYVPIDPLYPTSRKEFIMGDTGLEVLITETEYIFSLEYYKGNVFAIDVQLDALEEPSTPCNNVINPHDLAYIIYTSGSTGNPKGVMIEHAALLSSIRAQETIFGVEAGMRKLQFTSSSFDVSVFEIFITLASGGSLYMINEGDKKDPVLFERYINKNKIEIASILPAYLRLLDIESLRGMKKIITGGEPALPETVLAFSKTGTYYNAYGPTESSLCTSVFTIDKDTVLTGTGIPVGKPIPGVYVYVLDAHMNLVPVGVPGEICIGGSGLSRGYLNNTTLTAEKFVNNPFRKGERMYRTGDLGKWLQDGNLEFIGRKDDQVKIYGHRIELGEVERAVQAHPQVDAAAVIAKVNGQGEKELVAYIVSSEEISTADMLVELGRTLPIYMLPRHFVQLDELPLTRNGKVDRKSLPDPEGISMATGVEFVAPRNATEQKLVDIWEEILGRKNVGVKDDYFELGGSSLKAMVVVKRVLDETGVALPLKVVFEQKTIETIAKYLDGTAKEAVLPVTGTRNESTLTPASYNQLNYFSSWNNQGDHLVVNPQTFAELDIKALRKAFNGLVERHEMLRTVFVRKDGMVMQQILPAEGLDINIADPIELSSDEELKEIMAKEYFRKFEMDGFPLLAINVYKLNGIYTVLLNIHHVITDGYSGGILKDELMKLYTAALTNTDPALPPMRFQYRDFSAWQQSFLDSANGQKHSDYWQQRLQGFTHNLQLPAAQQASYGTGRTIGITRVLQDELYAQIGLFAKKNGLTLTAVFMGTLLLVLHEMSGQADITVCTNVSGRNSKYYGKLDVTGIIGFFANLLLVRNRIDTGIPVTELLNRIQSNFLDDLEYDAYPVDKLINELPGIQSEGFLDGTIFFNYHNYKYQKATAYSSETSDKEEVRGGENPLHMALGLSVTEFGNSLSVQLLFNSSVFPADERASIKERYFAKLQSIVHQ
jgi:amino acid adenylation domain-containing protein